MKKIEMLLSIEEMLDIMCPMVLESGLQKGLSLGAEIDFCLDVYAKDIREAYNWLKDIFENEYAEVMKVRNLLPEIIWERYKLSCDDDLLNRRESVMLREALKNLKSELKVGLRPALFKTTGVERLLRDRKADKK